MKRTVTENVLMYKGSWLFWIRLSIKTEEVGRARNEVRKQSHFETMDESWTSQLHYNSEVSVRKGKGGCSFFSQVESGSALGKLSKSSFLANIDCLDLTNGQPGFQNLQM